MPKHPDEISELFCQNYVQVLDAKKAYEATYSQFDTGMLTDKKAVSRRAGNMMRRRGVKGRISELLAQRSMATEDRVRTEVEQIAFSNITDVVEFGTKEIAVQDKEGNPVTDANGDLVMDSVPFVHVKDSSEIPAYAARAIKAVKQTANGITVEMHDKLSALTTLAQTHAGLQRVGEKDKAGAQTPTLVLFNADDPNSQAALQDLQKREEYEDALEADQDEEDQTS
ncbi:terminase small subunit [uncultured Pelagimonas sp.]|uniref:terminase small subunit n=1 Tax=uncultured Pelagimonas sp. TaxID=1618102 RepID=UPI0026365E14|nr:terminase small subunit [uncultured Pelagimonas sp.]